MNYHIRRSLRQDRRRRVKDAGTAIEDALAGDDLQGAWAIAKAWYGQSSGRAPKPFWQDFEELHRERSLLYEATESPGDPIPVRLSSPFAVLDAPPTANEVADACMDLRTGRAAGPSGIRPKDLREWLRDYQSNNELLSGKRWEDVLAIVDNAFKFGDLPMALTHSILVVIPKPSGNVRGIGLLETIWKLIKKIIDNRLARGIELHDAIHGFRKRRGCGTAILECRLEQERAICQGETLFQVFLDLTKAYDTLDRERTLLILEQYGVGPNVCRILRTFWDRLQLCPCQGGYYGRRTINSQRGVTQGGVASPTIFNIVVDAIVREWCHQCGTGLSAAFYADDGRLAGTSSVGLQHGLAVITDLFARVGMAMNAVKTKTMVGHNGSLRLQLSSPAYKRCMEGEGLSYRDNKRRKVSCPKCDAELQQASLARHLLSRHGDPFRP